MTIESIMASLALADRAFDLGGRLLEFMRQRHPELVTTEIADEGAAMEAARAEALKRAYDPERDD